ncbi:hypothetical protein BGZ96_007331 [Linnemannia gamsii]|uniref:Protein kinase domain-containing protein n=1 Tax=Linnemannia gamsii TaxID=64522 RepID=A0ABQ7K1B9_9FUNG|nr:hypothetical protein BGZ96_007331 [Linnemannia gamsii]
MPTIDFSNIIKHPLIKASEFSEVHGGTLIRPAPASSASIHSNSSSSSTHSSSSASPSFSSSPRLEPEYSPVVLKWSRNPADFRDLLHAFSKLRDLPQAPNIVTFYGATREHPSAAASLASTLANSPTQSSVSRTRSLSSVAASLSNLALAATVGTSANTSSGYNNTSTSNNAAFPPTQYDNMPRDWIVTKPSAHGTLHEFLKSPQGEALDWMGKIRLIRGVANGLLFLHEHGLLHMNLHSDNVLIENGPTAILTDFGQASRSSRGPEPGWDHDTNQQTSPKAGARWVHGRGVFEKGLIYTAPERLANPELNPCTTASDIYSLGVIMLEIMTGHRSHASHFLTSSVDHQLRLNARSPPTTMPTMSTPQGTMTLPSAMESLIRRICSRDPTQRPGLMVIRSQLKEMANTSFDLHVREPINKGTTGIQLNAKKPISLISVVTTPSVIAESSPMTPEPSSYSGRPLLEPLTPKSPNMIKKRTSILRKALDMSLNSPPASPKRKLIPIWEAAVKGDVKTINSLLSQGVSVNQRDPLTDHTPLIAAVADLENPNQAPNTTILELLINRGAEINAFDQKTKQTILHHLCLRPNPSPAVLKFLLDRGANPNAVSSARHTPLHYLAERAKSSPLEPMRLLLDSGAEVDAKGPVIDVDVNAKDSNRWTALHFVAHYNQDPAPALKILVDAGADVNALTKRHEGVIQVLLKSKSIDRLAALDLSQVAAASPTPSPVTATSGLGISGNFGGHARMRSTASNFSNNGSLGASSLRISSVAEVAVLASEQAEMANSGNVLLSPEDEAKEETLKKLADLIRWLMVDCGVHLEPSLDFEDKYPPSHPKNQHVLFRAIRLGMRPIVQVLLETSLAMSEIHVLDEALQVTDDMLTALNMSVQPQQQHNGSENGSVRMSLESSTSSTFRHRRTSSVSSNGSTLLSTNMSFVGGGGGGSSTNAASSTIVTPKSIAQAATSIHRTQEIEVLLKVWRYGDQRQQLLDSVKSRLARSNRRRASKSGRGQLGQGQGQQNGGGSIGGGSIGGGSSVAGDDDASVGCSSPVSSIHSEREREMFNNRSSTL